jgi:hypothetical protein
MQTSDFADLHQSCSACNAHIATSLQRINQFQGQEVIHVPIASRGISPSLELSFPSAILFSCKLLLHKRQMAELVHWTSTSLTCAWNPLGATCGTARQVQNQVTRLETRLTSNLLKRLHELSDSNADEPQLQADQSNLDELQVRPSGVCNMYTRLCAPAPLTGTSRAHQQRCDRHCM